MSLSRVVRREPIRASKDELLGHGIRYRSEDLFTGRSVASGAPVHFGLARITDRSLPFWRQYRLSAARITDLLAGLAKKVEGASGEQLDLAALERRYGWSRRRLAGIVDTMRRRSYGAARVFRSVQGGVTGIEWLLDEGFASTEDRFVAYAAKRPLPDDLPRAELAPDADVVEQVRFHERLYTSLLVSVGVATEQGLPTVTHFGIFRNPVSFLDADPGHRHLAMSLHAFAATVARHAWSGKVYMTTSPMPRMLEMLRGSLAAEDILICDSEAELRAGINERLPSGADPIADDRRFSFAGYTHRSNPIAVRLAALAQHYEPALDGTGSKRGIMNNAG